MNVTERGVVPMLFHDGVPINDTTYQCEYLDKAFPNSGVRLVPPETEPEKRRIAFEFRNMLDQAPLMELSFACE